MRDWSREEHDACRLHPHEYEDESPVPEACEDCGFTSWLSFWACPECGAKQPGETPANYHDDDCNGCNVCVPF